MYLKWKICSFWLNVMAWLSAAAGLITAFVELSHSFAAFIYWIVIGAVAFLFWRSLSLITKAAETYLRNNTTEYIEEEEITE